MTGLDPKALEAARAAYIAVASYPILPANHNEALGKAIAAYDLASLPIPEEISAATEFLAKEAALYSNRQGEPQRTLRDIADLLTRLSRAAPGEGNHKLDNDKQVFFYEQDFYVLSNFSAFTLQWKGIRFDTSEAAYHWEKFTDPGFDRLEVAAQIRTAPSAHEAFKIAEANKHLHRAGWNFDKVAVMHQILRAKADQHEYVRRKLLATGDRELIEDSWRDDFWGWGPNRDGQNMLGKLWMEVRAELRTAPLPPAPTQEPGR